MRISNLQNNVAQRILPYTSLIILIKAFNKRQGQAIISRLAISSAGAEWRSATWGEIMIATAKMRKARGAVVYGYHRDTPQVLSQAFPVFSLGHYAQNSGPRMKIAAYRIKIQIGDVWVNPGDLVFGDIDEVLIIPQAVEVQVIEKAKAEKIVRKEIESSRSSTEVFEEYGIF